MKVFLLAYLLLFFGLALILPSYRVWKTTGVNPYKFGRSESTHDYVGTLFRLTLLAVILIVSVYALLPKSYSYLVPIDYLSNAALNFIGQILLVIAVIWVLIAQVHMQKSWRIGIDEDVKTELIQTGLFKLSRNPIFLGMRMMMLGLFLVLPTAATLATLLCGDLLVQIQVRLEEEFLTRAHGETYRTYQKQVRRWI